MKVFIRHYVSVFYSSCVVVDTFRMLRGAISEIVLDDSFTVETTESQTCLLLARRSISLLSAESVEHKEFAEWLYVQLSQILIEAHSNQNINEDILWKKFHIFRSSEGFNSKWTSFLTKLCLNPYPLFYQHVTQELFETIISKRLVVKEVVSTPSTVRLTVEEENVVRYIGGYVIRMVKKTLHLPDNREIIDTLNLLVHSTEQPLTHTSHQWTESLDRGGLVSITDEAYECFCAIELGIRRHLNMANVDDMDDTFRSRLIKVLVDDSDVQFCWCLVGEMDEESGMECLEMIVTKWITIRGFSFAKSMTELYKQRSKKSTQKSKSLRTKLAS